VGNFGPVYRCGSCVLTRQIRRHFPPVPVTHARMTTPPASPLPCSPQTSCRSEIRAPDNRVYTYLRGCEIECGLVRIMTATTIGASSVDPDSSERAGAGWAALPATGPYWFVPVGNLTKHHAVGRTFEKRVHVKLIQKIDINSPIPGPLRGGDCSIRGAEHAVVTVSASKRQRMKDWSAFGERP